MARKSSGSKWLGLVVLVAAAVYGLGRQIGDGGKSDDGKSPVEVVANEQPSGDEGLGLPAAVEDDNVMLLHRVGYTVAYNKETRNPLWVAWHLTSDHTNGPYKRSGLKFAEDEEVPQPRATNADYRNSGYDRGHMCPSGDNRWSEEAQLQSFLYTNACPQIHGLNAGDWNELEQKCRDWATDYGGVYIVSGPLFDKGVRHKTIGPNKVMVPERFFKVVLRVGNDAQAIGFVCHNESGNRPLRQYAMTVDEVENLTGLDFFQALPDDIEERVESEASLSNWK